MSTRRSLRGASRQASSRGASPAVTDNPPTPRVSTRRAGNAPLPAVNLRASTAYGTNTVPAISSRSGHQPSQQLGDVLQNILKPVAEEETSNVSAAAGRGRKNAKKSVTIEEWPGSGAVKSTPNVQNGYIDPDRTFGEESEINVHGTFDTSSISQPSPPHETPQQQRPITNGSVTPHLKTRQQQAPPRKEPPQPISQQLGNRPSSVRRGGGRPAAAGRDGLFPVQFNGIHRPQIPDFAPNLKDFFLRVIEGASSIIRWSWENAKGGLFWLWAPILFLIIASAIFGGGRSTGDGVEKVPFRFYGFNIRHNVGQFIPNWVAHPLESLDAAGLQNIQTGLRTFDYKIASLKQQVDLDSQALAKIQKALPEFLVVKKDRHGVLQIPQDFWQALRDLIRSDDDLIPQSTGPISGTPSGADLSIKEFEKKAGKLWDKFLDTNRGKIASWSANNLDKRFPQLLKNNILASKSEIMDIIRNNWEDNQDLIKTELEKVTKDLEKAQRQILKLQQEPSGMSNDQLKSLISSHIKSILPIAQLEALAKSNIKGNVNYGLSRINHFSHGTGAVINPRLTAPNYVFPSMNVWFPKKIIQWSIGNPIPIPNPPDAALKSWEEHGDCWCAPAGGKDGRGPTLAVIMGAEIYPEEVVVEHIMPSASLEPGAAPKDMELWASVEGFENYDEVIALSKRLFSNEPEFITDFHYVRIATWTYDIESSDNIQAFPVQLDLKGFSIPTNRLVVRSKSNWGGGKVDFTCLYRIRVHGENSKTPGLES
ncbi:hypothetical protein G7Y89_g340 [Cudoniella acicularis]|uniref:SUN domain-containing protein n=1 Tax=Cudoniella acicularis TaxID=354080 RepID=A0A8H4WB93_9HELO|nr:hypothetical protein G7Y89_g340 [Cudoniella acicularis]